MRRDDLFTRTTFRRGEFGFTAAVAEVFDDMVVRSIPLYLEQQDIVTGLAKSLLLPGTDLYDLGCSTATTLVNLAREIGPPVRLIGYDNSPPMLERAKRKVEQSGLANRIEIRCGDLNGDLSD